MSVCFCVFVCFSMCFCVLSLRFWCPWEDFSRAKALTLETISLAASLRERNSCTTCENCFRDLSAQELISLRRDPLIKKYVFWVLRFLFSRQNSSPQQVAFTKKKSQKNTDTRKTCCAFTLFAELEWVFAAHLINIAAIRSPPRASGKFGSSWSDSFKR